MEFSGSRVNKGKNKVGDQLSSKKLKSTAHLSCVPVGKSRGPRQGTTAAVSWSTARSFGPTSTYITTKWQNRTGISRISVQPIRHHQEVVDDLDNLECPQNGHEGEEQIQSHILNNYCTLVGQWWCLEHPFLQYLCRQCKFLQYQNHSRNLNQKRPRCVLCVVLNCLCVPT